MLDILRRKLARSALFSFNQVLRDRWMHEQARKIPPGSRILDVGAGSAPYRKEFGHCEYRTHDFALLNSSQLSHGRYAQLDYVSDARAIPVPDASFDVVVCTEVLEHVPEPIAVVGELARILRPGGQLLLTAPLGSGVHQEPYHYYGGYTPFWYEKFLVEAGFRQVQVEANQGSMRFFAQESIRFARTTRPFALQMPLLAEVCWGAIWLLLVPALVLIIPVMSVMLDRFDRDKRFTVGYHVTATRADAAAA